MYEPDLTVWPQEKRRDGATMGVMLSISAGHFDPKADLRLWTGRLGAELGKLPGCPQASQEAYGHLAEATEKWEPGTSGSTQKAMRDDLWRLRENLSAQGQPEVPEAVRLAYEKVRNLSLNDNVRQTMQGFPSGHYNIPDPADIPNFSQVTPMYLRGGQATQDGMDFLATRAKSEVDLRDAKDRNNQWAPPHDYPLKVFPLGIPDFGEPTFKQVEEFIAIVDAPENQPVFVHCKAGVGRTGLMTACWRVSHGMPADEALKMESINSSYGSLKQEQFVRDFETYWQEKQARE